jgi:hypothetical protein
MQAMRLRLIGKRRWCFCWLVRFLDEGGSATRCSNVGAAKFHQLQRR